MEHRRGHHEDDQEHEHDVDERRDVDVRQVIEWVAGFAVEGHRTRRGQVSTCHFAIRSGKGTRAKSLLPRLVKT